MSLELHTLSGAYALDALSAEEAEEFRRHLEACLACRQEVHELRQAAAQMGASEAVEPPPGLRDKVLAEVDRTPQLPPRNAAGSNVVELRRRPWGTRLLVAAAAAALVGAAAVGIGRLGDDEQPLLAQEVVQVFEAEDASTETVQTTNGGVVSVATSPSRGEMAIDTDELPALEEGRVYQLWAIQADSIASVGVLERERGAAMEMPDAETVVAISIEPAGGSEQPTTQPIMQVKPSDV
jgi:anti-sigma-K factor RskA